MGTQTLKSADVDGLALAILTLGRELWVVKDRLKCLEDYMESKGMLPPLAVDHYSLSETQAQSGRAALDVFVSALASTMSGTSVP